MDASRPARPRGVGSEAEWDARAQVWRDGDYWYDERAADRAAAFFAEHLVLTTGEWAGQPFILADWQQDDIVRPLFGWKRADGTRRYRRCFVWIPRKNGKTELAAGIALLLLLGDAEQGGQVFAIATDEAQARIVFDKATTMVAKSETLSAELVALKTSIYCPELNAGFRPLTGRPTGKHGLDASGLVGDEIHEWSSADLYTFVHDSSSARRQPLEFLISTAGKRGGVGEEFYDECEKIRDGVIEDPETLVVIYAADPDDDWTDEAVWRKANPQLGVSKKLDTLRAACRRAQQLPRLENDFKRYQLNLWTEGATRWLPIDAIDDRGRRFGWNHCAGDTDWRDLEHMLAGMRCFGGLDLSSTTDLAGLVWWFPVQPGLDAPAVLARFFKPADLVGEHERRDKLPYRRWVDEGAIQATPGNVMDYAFIKQQVFADAEAFQVAYAGQAEVPAGTGGLAIDRWNATQIAVEMQQEGIPVVLFGQGYASMSAPAKELERMVMGNAFHHGDHPVLARHAKVVTVVTDPAENVKPNKAGATERIDGIVAQTMALGIAMRGREPEDAYVEGALVML